MSVPAKGKGKTGTENCFLGSTTLKVFADRTMFVAGTGMLLPGYALMPMGCLMERIAGPCGGFVLWRPLAETVGTNAQPEL